MKCIPIHQFAQQKKMIELKLQIQEKRLQLSGNGTDDKDKNCDNLSVVKKFEEYINEIFMIEKNETIAIEEQYNILKLKFVQIYDCQRSFDERQYKYI
jgi:hypothetical protein